MELSGQEKARLDKNICGGSVGGPILKDKLFFFGNYERCARCASQVVRAVPSDGMRDGVLTYRCADRVGVSGDDACRASRARTRSRPAITA